VTRLIHKDLMPSIDESLVTSAATNPSSMSVERYTLVFHPSL